jgi:hypothetical protein
MKRFLIILLFSTNVFGQNEPENVIYKGFYNLSFLVDNPIGNYKKSLKSDFVKSSNSGLSLSYLGNPKRKMGDLSSILLGGELGFVGRRQSVFSAPAPGSDFYMTHRQFWTNAKIRYLPNLAINKVLTYVDASFGPKFYTSKMMENVGEEEIYKVYGYNSVALNYGIESGLEYKISGDIRPFSYLNVGVGYTQSNAVKTIDRNRVGFTQDYEVIEAIKAVKPQSFYIKVGLTSYL